MPSKCIRFGVQKGSFCYVKGLLLECERTTFECLKSNFRNCIKFLLFAEHENIDSSHYYGHNIKARCQYEELTIANIVLRQSGEQYRNDNDERHYAQCDCIAQLIPATGVGETVDNSPVTRHSEAERSISYKCRKTDDAECRSRIETKECHQQSVERHEQCHWQDTTSQSASCYGLIAQMDSSKQRYNAYCAKRQTEFLWRQS